MQLSTLLTLDLLAQSIPAGPLYALAAAILWGGGDFSGGMGVKHAGGTMRAALRVVLLSHAASFAVLLLLANLRHDTFPHGGPLAWGIAAGVAGGLALTCFYIALSRGAMGASAALSGLLAAAIPAAVSMTREGSPGPLRLAGFAIAALAIWLIAGPPTSTPDPEASPATGTTALAIAAGVGFGLYFTALKYAGVSGLLWPMATARMGSLSICSLLLLVVSVKEPAGKSFRGRLALPRRAVPWSLSTALLDTCGNLLFIAATRVGRLDVAAVLASLYPATTILLAAWTLHERPTRRQGLGMAVAVAAVLFIAL